MCPPPPTFQSGGGGGQRYVCAPHFQTQNLGLGIEPTDICDVTLAWLASRCWAHQMCPPPPFCHVPTPLLIMLKLGRFYYLFRDKSAPARTPPHITELLGYHKDISVLQCKCQLHNANSHFSMDNSSDLSNSPTEWLARGQPLAVMSPARQRKQVLVDRYGAQ